MQNLTDRSLLPQTLHKHVARDSHWLEEHPVSRKQGRQ